MKNINITCKTADAAMLILSVLSKLVFPNWPIEKVKKALTKKLVASIDLIWVFLMPFLYNGVYLQWSILPHPSPTHIFSAQSFILNAQTQCSFVTHTHIYKPLSVLLFAGKKPGIFHRVNKK